MRYNWSIFLRATLTLSAAVLAGATINAASLPLGWLIGAMLVMVTAAIFHLPAVQPRVAMPYVKGSVGAMLGATILAGFLSSLGEWWMSLVVMFTVMLLGGALNFAALRRVFGFDRLDAALCSMPGGIAEMIFLGEKAGGDARRIAIVHAMRIALSILAIPLLALWLHDIEVGSGPVLVSSATSVSDYLWFSLCVLFGVAADRWTRLPLALILVPLVVSATSHMTGLSAFHVPPAVSATIQIIIGINVGARFVGVSLRTIGHYITSDATVFSIQITLAVCASFLLASWTKWDSLALLLAYAPGGLAEMSLIAVTMGRKVAFVAFHHILRVLSALFAAPFLTSQLQRRSE